MLTIIYISTTIGALLWGAITDFRSREIENGVHILLISAGLLSGLTIFQHIVGFAIPVLCLFLIEAISKKKVSGGGDVKLLAALGFNVGLSALFVILAITFSFAFLISRGKKSIPLCTYTFVGFLTVGVTYFTFVWL